MGAIWKTCFVTHDSRLMRPIAPAKAFPPIASATIVGGAIMFARARYVESCWVPVLYRLYHKHCVVPWIFDHRIDIVAYVYIAIVFSAVGWLALRNREEKA